MLDAFPLNALVDDQKTRLRKYFQEIQENNSEIINQNKIYFGSYTGGSGFSKLKFQKIIKL